MMEINLVIGEPLDTPADFHWKHFADGHVEITIRLHSVICKWCNKNIFDIEEYTHALEHEFIECVALTLCHEDRKPEDKWNGHGFNEALSGFHSIKHHHHCEGGCVVSVFG